MKYLISILFLMFSSAVLAQTFKPQTIGVSYFGETITHSGMKVFAEYNLFTKVKNKKKNSEKNVYHSILLTPSIAYFYHKNYQHAALGQFEVGYNRTSPNGNYWGFGVGVGYMRTFIPNVYELSPTGNIESISAGDNYFTNSYSFTIGKEIARNSEHPFAFFIKPIFTQARPSIMGTTPYFFLEIGTKIKLK
ncbi:hypothetical protein ACE193_05445 [Bernardetia sp. OM2101]|uniref:hypothetical protein n=1 Tax=Bernardetia sp. OM2101 TaxID=3344876 RepID=UPI0035D0F971